MKIIYLIQSDTNQIRYDIPKRSEILLLQWQNDYRESNISSFHCPNSTWASGRNALYNSVNLKNYDYLIFLDDDLMLEFSLTDYEKFLYEYKPLRSSVFVYGHYFYRELTDDSKVYNLKHIDQAFMAVSTSAASVFPYSTEKDAQSWFIANEEFCCRFHESYPEQTIIAPKFKMHNSQHREYPRNGTLVSPEDQQIFKIHDLGGKI
jgi:hypothetical protein